MAAVRARRYQAGCQRGRAEAKSGAAKEMSTSDRMYTFVSGGPCCSKLSLRRPGPPCGHGRFSSLLITSSRFSTRLPTIVHAASSAGFDSLVNSMARLRRSPVPAASLSFDNALGDNHGWHSTVLQLFRVCRWTTVASWNIQIRPIVAAVSFSCFMNAWASARHTRSTAGHSSATTPAKACWFAPVAHCMTSRDGASNVLVPEVARSA